ncbi:MAG: VanZ family protein [Bryobacteraceae bacterium]
MKPAADTEAAPHRRILGIVIALILYGSLYPWQFHVRHYGRSPLWILVHAWPDAVNRYLVWDVAVNVALYLPLGIFAYLSVSARAPQVWRVMAPLVLAVGLSASIEMLQLFDDGRMCSLSDVASNAAGAAIGIAAGAYYRTRWQRLLAAPGAAALLRPSGALLLLSCWIGYQVFPMFPVWGRTNLFRRLTAMPPWSSLSPVDTLVVLAEWLTVACLLENVRGRKATGWLTLLLVLVPARLFIAGRTLAWPDIVGAAGAYAVWLWLPRRGVRRALPFVLTGALIVAELAPFHWQSAQAFNWVPFRATFRTAWQDGLVVLFRKSFWYGSVLWLWRASGLSLAWVTAAAAVVLFGLERVQVYLPGRTPEITDAVLAVLMGVLLWLLRDA